MQTVLNYFMMLLTGTFLQAQASNLEKTTSLKENKSQLEMRYYEISFRCDLIRSNNWAESGVLLKGDHLNKNQPS